MAERTAMGSPFTGVAPYREKAQTRSNLTILRNMAALTEGVSTIMLDAQEEQSVMDAQNDLVNDSVIPDKKLHDAAYAWTTAEGDAWNACHAVQSEVADGKYNDTDPEDFQKMLRNNNTAYYEGWADNENAAGAVGAYNKVMLRHMPAVTAGQAGKWRQGQTVKQGQSLTQRIIDQANAGAGTKEDFMATIESPQYTLLDATGRMEAALIGATNHAEQSGDSSLLKGLNEEFSYDTHPKFKGIYAAGLKVADRKRTALTAEQELEFLNTIHTIRDAGALTMDLYPAFSTQLSASGGQLMPAKEYRAMVIKSKIIHAGFITDELYKYNLEHGEDLSNASQKSFNKTVKNAFIKFGIESEHDPIKTTENIGRYLARQTKVWGEMQAKASAFNTLLITVDGSPNPELIRNYEVLEAFERGLSAYTQGEGKFAKYMGASLSDYIEIKTLLKSSRGQGTEEEAWKAVTATLEATKKYKGKQEVLGKLSQNAKTYGKNLTEEIYEYQTNIPFVPDFIERKIKPHHRVKRHLGDTADTIAILYQSRIDAGLSPEVAERYAKEKVYAMTESLGGKVVTTYDIPLSVRMKTSNPDAALKSLYDDPEYGVILTEMFNNNVHLELTDLPFGLQPPHWLKEQTEFIFGTRPAVTVEDRRKITKIKEDIEFRTYLDRGTVDFNLNTETGMLEFVGTTGEDPFYAIPLIDIGILHEAKKHDIANILNLDRLYKPKFFDTDAGKVWHNKQTDLNAQFVTEVLDTDVAENYQDVPSKQDYILLDEKGKTAIRMKFHKDNYEGVKGRAKQIRDYFKLKIKADKSIDINNPDGRYTHKISNSTVKDTKVTIKKGVAVKNNNPGNLTFMKQKGAILGAGGFAKFKTPEAGFEALKRQVTLDQDRGDTIRTFLEVYAPKKDGNDTEAYIKFLADALGGKESDKLSNFTTKDVATYVAQFESGTIVE